MAAAATMLSVLSLVLILSAQGTAQAAETLKITVTFPVLPSDLDQSPLITTSDLVSSSLLESGTPLTLWGFVKPEEVRAVCQHIEATGNLTVAITAVDGHSGTHEEDLSIQIESVRGCEACGENVETEAVLIDRHGKKSLLICSSKEGASGCNVYQTGDAIANLRKQRERMLKVCIFSCYGCFPGDATVRLANGDSKQMVELNLGDEIAVRKPNGALAYEPVYASGHKDAAGVASFIKITMAQATETAELRTLHLELTPGHFVLTSSGSSGQKILYKRAQDVEVGDTMWASAKENLVPYTVTDTSIALKTGLYNPFTMGGTIVVNGVVASVHSEWFLDNLFDSLGLTHLLPAAYQVILSPPRIVYRLLGKQVYIKAYTWLNVHFNVEKLVSDYAAAATISVASAILAPICLVFLSNKKQ